MTITQSVTIAAAPGVQASISPSSGNAITVNAGPSDKVILSNLNLNGQGASYGVYYQSGGALHIEGVSVNGFTGDGVVAWPSSPGMIYLADSVVRNNGAAGISLGNTISGTIVRTRLEGNTWGLYAGHDSRVTVKDSVASGNERGFQADSNLAPAVLNLEGCVASFNSTYGVYATGYNSTSTVRVSNCTVTGNGIGIMPDTNGTILSRGNNTVEGNTTDGSFSGTFAAK